MKDNYPCRCGHKEISHNISNGFCYKCAEQGVPGRRLREAMHNFIPDNLKFLEQKYNQQILNKYRKLEVPKEI